jgi:hypothetical protein
MAGAAPKTFFPFAAGALGSLGFVSFAFGI